MMCASTTSPVGARMMIEYELFVPLANSTHASTNALAAVALICVFISVRLATSSDTITFDSGTGVVPWARNCPTPSRNVASPTINRVLPINPAGFITCSP